MYKHTCKAIPVKHKIILLSTSKYEIHKNGKKHRGRRIIDVKGLANLLLSLLFRKL